MRQESEVYIRFGTMPDIETDPVIVEAIRGGIEILDAVESIQWKLGGIDWNMTEPSFKSGMGWFAARDEAAFQVYNRVGDRIMRVSVRRGERGSVAFTLIGEANNKPNISAHAVEEVCKQFGDNRIDPECGLKMLRNGKGVMVGRFILQ